MRRERGKEGDPEKEKEGEREGGKQGCNYHEASEALASSLFLL